MNSPEIEELVRERTKKLEMALRLASEVIADEFEGGPKFYEKTFRWYLENGEREMAKSHWPEDQKGLT